MCVCKRTTHTHTQTHIIHPHATAYVYHYHFTITFRMQISLKREISFLTFLAFWFEKPKHWITINSIMHRPRWRACIFKENLLNFAYLRTMKHRWRKLSITEKNNGPYFKEKGFSICIPLSWNLIISLSSAVAQLAFFCPENFSKAVLLVNKILHSILCKSE